MADDSGLSDARVVEIMNKSFAKGANPSVSTLSGGNGGGDKIVRYDRDSGVLTMLFRGSDAMCNGKPGPKAQAQVQGGFAGAMLDAVVAQSVVVHSKLTKTVASLEQKTTWVRPVPPNQDLFGTATLLKMGRSIAFYTAELRLGAPDGPLLVSASQTLSLVALPAKKPKAKL